ncbi:hypothetical protein LFM56_05845 [Cellulomonas iranensis]|uniref:hypothetical protein n=1 Tax=Cellulomonas iranensis TaxID=76862 RepID=UPI001CF3C479|nr:hypothetical protein [Cellulomonas iranensis]UCN15835.1 hypothetical protein LFM56_05845 [Cellulomonas iranensis]
MDVIDLAGEVLPRRWLRAFWTCLLIGMLATGSTVPVLWYVMAKSEAIHEDLVAPMLDNIAELATPTPAPSGVP